MLLNKHNLKVAEVASKETSRFTLQAILIDNDGTVATDGHRLLKVTLPSLQNGDGLGQQPFPAIAGFEPANGDFKPVLLDRETALSVAKHIPKVKHLPVLNHAIVGKQQDGHINLAVTDLDRPQVIGSRIPAGNFPHYQAVIPRNEPKHRVLLSAEYLLSVAKFAAEFTKAPFGTVAIEFRGPDKAVIFRAKNHDTGQEMTALLMPMYE